MKFLHTSDWHLGASAGIISLKTDQEYFINEICRIIEDENIDAVLLAGDIFDRSVSSADAIRLYDTAMTRICVELGKKVFLIAGNHDSAERLASCRELLQRSGMYVAGALTREPEAIPCGDADIYLLPWFTEGKVKSLFPEKEEEIKTLEDAYRVVTDSIKSGFSAGRKHIVLSHAFITDSETSLSDRAAEIGFASQVPASVFDGFDYVALGHIHKPQAVNSYIRYCGTPMPFSFGKEETQEKSVVILDTDTMSQQLIPLPLLHKWTTLTGTLSELLNPSCPGEITSGYVRLNVTDSYVGLETVHELKKIYPNILEFSGKTFEGDNSSISMTMEEFEKLESDPLEIFKSFCREVMEEEPDGHLISMFLNSLDNGQEDTQ